MPGDSIPPFVRPCLPSGRAQIVGALDELGEMSAPGILTRRVWRPLEFLFGRS